MFSCDYCEIFKNTYFEEQLRMAAPVHDFLVNALRAGLIYPALENTLSVVNFPVPFF